MEKVACHMISSKSRDPTRLAMLTPRLRRSVQHWNFHKQVPPTWSHSEHLECCVHLGILTSTCTQRLAEGLTRALGMCWRGAHESPSSRVSQEEQAPLRWQWVENGSHLTLTSWVLTRPRDTQSMLNTGARNIPPSCLFTSLREARAYPKGVCANVYLHGCGCSFPHAF